MAFVRFLIAGLAKTPSLLRALFARLRGLGFTGTTGAELLSWVGQNKDRAILIGTIAASLGVDLFKTFQEQNQTEVLNEAIKDFGDDFVKKIESLQAGDHLSLQPNVITLVAESEEAARAAAASEALDLKIAEVKHDLEIARGTLAWAKQFFGSENAAIRAHLILQAFMEMPHDDVLYGFEHLKTR